MNVECVGGAVASTGGEQTDLPYLELFTEH